MPVATPVVPQSVFDTARVPAALRFAAWREAISVLFDVSYDGRDDAARFPASIEAYLLGTVTLARCRGARQRFDRTSVKLARDGTDCYLIELFLGGGSATRGGDPAGLVRPGDLLIIDAAQPMATETSAFHNANLGARLRNRELAALTV